jgi:hypothetical protein
MINLFVFNLKHFKEGIISSKRNGAYPSISLKLVFESRFGNYSYVFSKNTYNESYLDKIRTLLSRIYANVDQGNTLISLDFDNDGELLDTENDGFIFDKVIISDRDQNYKIAYTEYKLK